MRQLGGSSGIAIVNTFLHTRNAIHRSDLLSNITTDNPQVVARLNSYVHYFISKGFTEIEANHKALAVLESTVTRQTTLLSFNDSYLLVGSFFLLALPLLLLASRKKTEQPKLILADH